MGSAKQGVYLVEQMTRWLPVVPCTGAGEEVLQVLGCHLSHFVRVLRGGDVVTYADVIGAAAITPV